MARTQFSFQKRQKELAKKKKKEEKLALRRERKLAGADDGIATVNEFGEVIETPADEESQDEENQDETPADPVAEEVRD